MTESGIKIVVIGGVAAGASFAARARRLSESARITVVERGPDVSFANCGLPYFIGGEITDRSRLALQTPQSLSELLAIDVRAGTEAVSIDRAAKMVRVKNLAKGTEETLAYDKLVLAPGAAPLRPPLPGIESRRILTLRNLQDMDAIVASAAKAKRTLIIGAGFIGLEMAEQLARLGKSVVLAEQQKQVLPQLDPEMTAQIQAELEANDVGLILGDAIAGFAETSSGITATLQSGRTIETDLVILSIGVRPESRLATEAGLTLGARGAIAVNGWMQTSDPDIYAAGDVVESRDRLSGEPMNLPMGGPANRQGRVIADHLFLGDKARPYPGHIGTAIVRVFDAAAGMTGWTEKRLRLAGRAFQTTTVTDNNHAGYFPGAVPVTLKILWEPETGKLLGAQATGPDGVDKRLDILATALAGGLTTADLVHLELSYAPPFGSARDVVNTAGFAAENLRGGLVNPVRDLPDDPAVQVLDVRPPVMAANDPIPGSINVPFKDLRSRLDEFDRSRPILAVCALGKTSYFASRVLSQNGFQAQSLTGGWRLAGGASAQAHIATVSHPSPAADPATMKTTTLDTTGLMCPGPLLKLREAIDGMAAGDCLEIQASDPGFARDVEAFCKTAGHTLLGLEKSHGVLTARVQKAGADGGVLACPTAGNGPSAAPRSGSTLVCFSGELDKAMAAFIIATGAAAMGGQSTIFFTFWGLNVIRRETPPAVEKDLMGKMFGMMMPRGADKLPLSNMHMAGMGTAMMKHRMGSKNLPTLPGLIEDARKAGVRMLACSMSMEAMGITLEELVDGVELGGVADMLACSAASATSMFI